MLAKRYLVLCSLLLSSALYSDVKVGGFIDAYYVYDNNSPDTDYRQDFLFNHNRHNEININLALAKIGVNKENYRAAFALQAGTYAEDNYAHEPDGYNYIHEANVGIALDSEDKLWLDVGVFASHLGFDNAVSLDNYNLTRSLSAESSPYYLSGAKLTYLQSQELELVFIVCNGWQRIKRVEENSYLSFGTQVVYKPNSKIKFNWSTFVGNDEPDQTRKMRIFNNFYTEYGLNDSLSFIAGVDIGAQQKQKGSSAYDWWYIPSLLAKYSFSEIWGFGARLEYIEDNKDIVRDGIGRGLQTFGVSGNIDYKVSKDAALRAEARYFKDKNRIYSTDDSSNLFFTTSLAIRF